MKKVLLIDDDADDSELFAEALEEIESKTKFQHYSSANEARQKLIDEKTDIPDIIFLDINLPVTSGWELLQSFKNEEHLASIPIFMYTTSSQTKEKEMAQTFGAAGFITKPNDFMDLKNILKSVIGV